MDLCKKTENPNSDRKPVVYYFSTIRTESVYGRISPTPDTYLPAMSEDTVLDTFLDTHGGSLQDTLLARAQLKVKEEMERLQLDDIHRMSGSLDKELHSYTKLDDLRRMGGSLDKELHSYTKLDDLRRMGGSLDKEILSYTKPDDVHRMSASLDRELQNYSNRFQHTERRPEVPGGLMYDVEMYTEYESLDLNEKYAADNKGYTFLPMVREKSLLHLGDLDSTKTSDVNKEKGLQPPFKLTGFETLIKLWNLDNWRLNC